MPECRTVRHPVSLVPDWKKLMMPEPIRTRTKLTQSGIFWVRYRTAIMDAGMPMPALVSSMPMPSYGCNQHCHPALQRGRKVEFEPIERADFSKNDSDISPLIFRIQWWDRLWQRGIDCSRSEGPPSWIADAGGEVVWSSGEVSGATTPPPAATISQKASRAPWTVTPGPSLIQESRSYSASTSSGSSIPCLTVRLPLQWDGSQGNQTGASGPNERATLTKIYSKGRAGQQL